MTMTFRPIANGESVPIQDIPHLPFDAFCDQAVDIVADGGKVVHFFAYQIDKTVRLMAILRNDALLAASCDAPERYPSLTIRCEPFHMFEREIAEQYGIRPEGHPWLKMVRYHANCRGVEDAFGNDYSEDIPGKYDYYRVAGEEIHEVAVGPVHAGVIEPGHFRFNCIGERVLNLEIQLGYQHRGAEDLLLNADPKRLPFIAENIAGDTSVGHSLCHSQAMEALSATQVDEGARIIRSIGLELERIANHVGDLGGVMIRAAVGDNRQLQYLRFLGHLSEVGGDEMAIGVGLAYGLGALLVPDDNVSPELVVVINKINLVAELPACNVS